MYKKCKGCVFSSEGYEICLIKHIERLREKCPCSKCLVKGICQVMCDERSDLYKDSFTFNEFDEMVQKKYKREYEGQKKSNERKL